MKKPSDQDRQQADLRAKILGMGERSIRKSYYPALRRQMDALERYRELLHRADSAICLLSYPSLRFLDANPSACRLFSVIANRQAEKSLPEAVDPHSAEAVESWIREPVPRTDPFLRLESVVSPDEGDSVMIDLTLTLVDFRNDRYVVCVAQDITERKEAERGLTRALEETEASQAKIDTILRSMDDGLLAVGLDGRVSLMNKYAERVLECSADAAVSHPFEETVNQEELQRQIRAVLAGEDRTMITDFEIAGPSPKAPRTIRAKTSSVLGLNNKRTGSITVLRDISREKALDRMKDEFISTAAHELRTPLTSLMGYSEILRESGPGGFPPDQQQEFLDIIYQKAEELSRIVDDLLDLNRVQTGQRILLDRRPGDLGQLLREVVQACALKKADIQLVLNLPESPLELDFDRTRIIQLMQNLLSNAFKFSTSGSTIRVFARTESRFCIVGVEDEGIGMSSEELDHIFDKFYRADASNTGFSGLGLGMAIVRQIVEAHGGEILVYSEKGCGTEVTFSLPLEPQPSPT